MVCINGLHDLRQQSYPAAEHQTIAWAPIYNGGAMLSSPPELQSVVASDSQAVINYIRQMVHALEIGSRAAQKSVGLSGAQLFVLQTLASAGAMSLNELAARSHTHQSSL